MVKQKKELVEIVTGFEQENTYDIFNKAGQQVKKKDKKKVFTVGTPNKRQLLNLTVLGVPLLGVPTVFGLFQVYTAKEQSDGFARFFLKHRRGLTLTIRNSEEKV